LSATPTDPALRELIPPKNLLREQKHKLLKHRELRKSSCVSSSNPVEIAREPLYIKTFLRQTKFQHLSRAGQVFDRGGLTKAGRALDKHGNRVGSVFPKATGNNLNKNLQGQFQLDDILTDPRSFILREKNGYKIYSKDGRGVYYRNDGTMKGFIEFKYE